jgi:hypothetical protein
VIADPKGSTPLIWNPATIIYFHSLFLSLFSYFPSPLIFFFIAVIFSVFSLFNPFLFLSFSMVCIPLFIKRSLSSIYIYLFSSFLYSLSYTSSSLHFFLSFIVYKPSFRNLFFICLHLSLFYFFHLFLPILMFIMLRSFLSHFNAPTKKRG